MALALAGKAGQGAFLLQFYKVRFVSQEGII